ncbi:MAG: uroporphyrinogen decarboxylase [Saprospiraceae bacterium]|jgi:uroporphyrinogen decarboxylase
MSYHNNLLLDVLEGKKVARPPVWVMRQAGRILPGYRKIRASVGSFKGLVKRPDLISEVTVEPLQVLGVDAAILFSDILVIPEAMGVNYEIVEKVGPIFESPIMNPSDIDRLISGIDVLPNLDYVFESIYKTKQLMDGSNPLIGFAGAPWTLFAYMIEGSGSKTFSKARRFLYEEPEASHRLLGMIADSTAYYLKEKINVGVDAIQLFDSWAGSLTVAQYKEFCLPYIKRILDAVEGIPRIFFPKGAWSSVPSFTELNFEAIGIDWTTPVEYIREHLGTDQIIQGNMDPAMLYADPETISVEVHKLIRSVGGKHIFNLGHGVYPDTSADHVKVMVDAVKTFRY